MLPHSPLIILYLGLKQLHLKLSKISKENYILFVLYAFVFFIFIFQDAIYSPDTYDYLRASIYRNSGYVIFVKLFSFLPKAFFDVIVVGIQLLINLCAIHFFYKILVKRFNLRTFFKIIALAILIFPIFPPLYVANNICSEALSYPLYLLLVGFTIEFLTTNKTSTFWYLIMSYMALTLTRGQFVFIPLIIAFIYMLRSRPFLFEKKALTKILILIVVPIVTVFADKTYHRLKDGQFFSTPLTYVSTITAPFFVSTSADMSHFEDQDSKTIFEISHQTLNEKNLLMDSAHDNFSSADYQKFFDKFPYICNRTIHNVGKDYFRNKGFNHIEAGVKTEQTFKTMLPILIEANFKDWSSLFLRNLIHGFHNVLVLLALVILTVMSAFRLLKAYTQAYACLFLMCALTLSNGLLVAFASHTIIRYFFYNYIFLFLILVILSKIIKNARKA